MAKRLQAMGKPSYQNGFQVTIHEELFERPLQWKSPRLIFVNSMSDLFHQDVPLAFIRSVFDVMRQCPQHIFQVLTKRSERMMEDGKTFTWPENVWMGVTVESADYAYRIDHLRQTPAKVRFLSVEPLLGPMPKLDLEGIHWIIVGGESGPKARIMEPEWVRGVLDQCRAAGIPFFFKQWGGTNKKKSGRELDGRTWDETPLDHLLQLSLFERP